MKKILFVVVLGVSGCASSTGIVPMGPDTYMVSRQGGGPGSTGALKAESIREATAFCAEKQQQFMIVNSQEVPSGVGRFPQAEIQFRCLSAGDPELVRPVMRNEPSQVIEIRR